LTHHAQGDDMAEELDDATPETPQTPEAEQSFSPIAKRPLSIKLNVNYKKPPSVAETELAVTPSAQTSTSEPIPTMRAESPDDHKNSNNETEDDNNPLKVRPPNDANGLLQIPEPPKTDGRRTSRRAAATAAKKKLKADSDAEDADDEYRPAAKGVRVSTRVTRSRAR